MTAVDSGGGAAAAGVRPGSVIEAIDGQPIDEVIRRRRAENPDFELTRLRRIQATEDALRARPPRR